MFPNFKFPSINYLLTHSMELISHTINNKTIIEIVSDSFVISELDDALDVLGNAYYLGATGMIIHENNLSPDFFDLSTKIAGEILQKFSTYQMHLAIVGDFNKFKSKSLHDFIYESNKTGKILFVSTLEEAKERIK